MLKAMRCDVLLISLRCKRMSTWNSLFLLFSVVSLWCKGFHYSKYFHLTYLLNLFVCVCVFFLFPQLLQGNMYVFGGEFTATNETPLWTFNFRKCVVFSVEIILHLRSFSFLIQTPLFLLRFAGVEKTSREILGKIRSIFSWVPKRPVNGRF